MHLQSTQPDPELSFVQPKPHYSTPKHPIVLCHGFSGFDQLFLLPVFGLPPLTDRLKAIVASQKLPANGLPSPPAETSVGIDNRAIVQSETTKYLIEYWNGIKENLENIGCTVLVAKVPPFAAIETRANVLHEFIEKAVPRLRAQHPEIPPQEPVKINLIAHSMGGLDCRYLIHKLRSDPYLELHYKIVSLTTISTPHRGTSAANFALKYSPSTIIDSFFPSIGQLTTDSALKFNHLVKDDPDVKYFSYGSQFKPNPTSMFFITWKIVYDKEGSNDGLVSLKSAKWGDFKGYINNVDHADLINWMGLIKKARMAMGIHDFNPDLFYRDVVDNLANNDL